MARSARFLKDGVCYYIRSQGARGRRIFRKDCDYERYLQLLKKYKSRFQIHVYGYCLMPGSAHLIAHPLDAGQLPRFMQGINESYALYFNRRYQKAGKVWSQRYKSVLIGNDHDLVECIKIVEHLPVKVRIACSPARYAHSSCPARIMGSGGMIDAMPPEGTII